MPGNERRAGGLKPVGASRQSQAAIPSEPAVEVLRPAVRDDGLPRPDHEGDRRSLVD
jgi:hypothetical protein